MLKSCFIEGCDKDPSSVCNCTSPEVYACVKHLGLHVKENTTHCIASCVKELTTASRQKLLKKAKEILKSSKATKEKTKDFLLRVIEETTMQAKNSIAKICKLEKKILFIIQKASSSQFLDNDLWNSIKNPINVQLRLSKSEVFSVLEDSLNLKYVQKEKDWLECNKILFPDPIDRKLKLIDLNTFNLSEFQNSPETGYSVIGCKMDKKRYFLIGGRYPIASDCCIVNLKDFSVDLLPKSSPRCHGGSVYKNNKVYVFGGNSDGVANRLDVCEVFNMKIRVWQTIEKLPQGSYGVTAAKYDLNIIVSGYHLEILYMYDDTTYTKILDLDKDTDKIICEDWVYNLGKLYERTGENWTVHRIYSKLEEHWPLIFTTFKRNNYIYFMLQTTHGLRRINTSEKTIEKIIFS